MAKEPPEGLWTQVAGARHNSARDIPTSEDLVKASPTPVDAHLYAVSFREPERGFAGGTINKAGETVPALYRHTEAGGWQQDTSFTASGKGFVAAISWIDDKRALAVGGDGAYPVRERDDGTSTCAPEEDAPIDQDQAGRARAWLYEAGNGWRELRNLADGDPGDEVPDAMGGLTALDFYLPDPAKPIEFGIAGGLCQIWHWSEGSFLRDDGGGFKAPYSHQSSVKDVTPDPRSLRFRVRSVAFAKPTADLPVSQRRIRAHAVTTGCCLTSPHTGVGAPVELSYQSQSVDGQWKVGSSLMPPPPPDPPGPPGEPPAKSPGDPPDPHATPDPNDYADPWTNWAEPIPGAWGSYIRAWHRYRERYAADVADNTPTTWSDPPDSFLSVTATYAWIKPPGCCGVHQVTHYPPGIVASPAAPKSESEPSSHVGGRSVGYARVRLIDGGGDTGGGSYGSIRGLGSSDSNPSNSASAPVESPATTVEVGNEGGVHREIRGRAQVGGDEATGPDGIPDWSVGELTATGQGVAFATDPEQMLGPASAVENPPRYDLCLLWGDTDPGEYMGCQGERTTGLTSGIAQQYESPSAGKTTDRALGAASSHKLLKLPSYRLNAINVLDGEDVGWAVGDHGGILRLTVDRSRAASRAGDPDPPQLGARDVASAPGGDEWGRAGSGGEPGTVPPLATQPRRREAEPALHLESTLETGGSRVKQVVMSRSGDEGWALLETLGNSALPMDLAHFDGERWTYCDPRVSPEKPPASAACEGVSELREAGVQIKKIVRVPLERDLDPANDDELELAALASSVGVVRYSGGRWTLDDSAGLSGLRGAFDLAFTAPNNGWAIGPRPSGGPLDSIRRHPFYRFDGKQWIQCLSGETYNATDHCDPKDRLPADRDDGEITALHAAGDRIYAVGVRNLSLLPDLSGLTSGVVGEVSRRPFPMILYRRDGEKGWAAAPREGEYDPGAAAAPNAAESGTLDAASIVVRANGTYEGWTTGTRMLRMRPGSPWKPFHDRAAVRDYGMGAITMLAEPGPGVPSAVMVAPSVAGGQIFQLNDERARWEILRTDRAPDQMLLTPAGVAGSVDALAPDGKGSFWAALGSSFYRYTDRPREPVFTEAPQPSHRMGARALTSLAAAPDGTLWAASSDQTLYRYDRRLGWDALRIPGWEPGRIVTAPSSGFAIALNRHGEGVVVGRRGRIAQVSRSGVALDPAAGTRCTGAAIAPCGTGNDLLAADVADDGSAVVAGEGRSILWRPPGGQFRAIDPPVVSPDTRFSAVAITRADRIWLATQNRRIYAGRLVGTAGWQWTLEAEPASEPRAMALNESGTGYVVGADGLILERSKDAEWKTIDSPRSTTLLSVALPAAGGEGALIGGAGGLVLTRSGEGFEVARERIFNPQGTEDVVSVALSPGYRDGQVEAWALTKGSGIAAPGRGTSRLLHHSSDPSDPMLTPRRTPQPLPDSPAKREGELSLGAFGKMDCRQQPVIGERCFELPNANDYVNTIGSRISDELVERSRGQGAPGFALFTGDAVDVAGYTGDQAIKSTTNADPPLLDSFVTQSRSGARKLQRWGEAIADELTDRGVPLFAAPGAQDLPETRGCEPAVTGGLLCVSANELIRGNENTPWRQAMRQRSRPWGSGPKLDEKRLRFRPVRDPITSQRLPNLAQSGKDEAEFAVPTGGAPTHYAIDVYDDSRSQREVARIVVVDSSFGSLAASDPVQQPLEPDGQAAWLEKVLCIKGTPGLAHSCSRKPHQRAIVVSNAPTYSYGPGAGTHTAADGTAFELILMKNKADLVVSGRIGWNGRYWATAPGLHEPCPGGEYPTKAPEPGSIACGQGTADLPTGAATNHPATAGLAATLGETTEPAAAAAEPLTDSVTGLLPFVVASGAGGKFADENGEAKDGFWHGYTIVRLDPSGDPRKTIVEQRPVYDWIGIEAQERILRPGQRLKLRGFGRGPIGIERNRGPLARYDRIDGPAVTHRYDLVEADPERRWLPRKGTDGEYVALDPSIATVDTHTGQVRAGRGNHPRAHAVAILSMGCAGESSRDCDASRLGQHVATYPLIFEPRRTFEPKAQAPSPRTPSVIVQSAAAGISPPGSPGAPPQVGSLSPPALPSFPSVQPPPATPPIGQPTPTPPPPPPPAPPPPAPLGIAAAPPGLTVAPPAAVIPPPAPPINPAPPGGARKEARQRQAATEKSGSGADGAGDAQELGGDMANVPPGPDAAPMTRRDRVKASPSFTVVARHDQPSAWARNVLYGGGLAVAALAMAGFWTARPRPRGRRPAVPVPAPARGRLRG